MTEKLELKSCHEVIDTVDVANIENIFYGKPTDPDILTVVMKDGKRLYCDEVCPIDSLPEEPVSEELEEAAKKHAKCQREDDLECGYDLTKLESFIAGAKWKEEQVEKNRLKHCNSITNEQAEMEQKFLDEHLDKNNRMPTFLDAIEYGMRLQKQQMMKGAFEFAQKHNDACVLASECLRNHGWFNREHDFNDLFLYLSCVDELFAGKFSGKTKVIVIKED